MALTFKTVPGATETPNAADPINKDKKSRTRSPNYPGIGLEEAVAKIDAFYKQDKLAASPKDAALKHMGFDKAHGEAGRTISALKSFGLIVEVADRIKLAQRGIDIIVREVGDPVRLAALRDAAISPEIYRQLLREYQGPASLPSDTTLRSELIAVKKFNPNAVDGFIRDFRGTLEFAGLSDLSAIDLDLGEDDESMIAEQAEPLVRKPDLRKPDPTAEVRQQKPLTPPPGASLLAQTLPISIPRNLRVEVQVRGDELKKEDLAKIKSQITRWLEGLDEAFE